MKWLEKRRRDRRGKELLRQVPKMRKYLKEQDDACKQSVADEAERQHRQQQAAAERAELKAKAKATPPVLEPDTASPKPITVKTGREVKAKATLSVPKTDKATNEPAPEKTAQAVPERPQIRYSLRDWPVDELDRITDMEKFRDAAKKDIALYNSPAMNKAYRQWEKANSERKTFSSEVIRIVEGKFRKPSEFYHAAGIDKRIYHRIKSDYCYQPSRDTAIRCCVALRLNGKEADELLKLAGYALSPCDPNDLVIRFCLDNGIWDMPGVHYMLYMQQE